MSLIDVLIIHALPGQPWLLRLRLVVLIVDILFLFATFVSQFSKLVRRAGVVSIRENRWRDRLSRTHGHLRNHPLGSHKSAHPRPHQVVIFYQNNNR